MKKVLITGISGFVAKFLVEHLKHTYADIKIYGISRQYKDSTPNDIEVFIADLRNEDILLQIIKKVSPDIIFHLASDSSVAYSWKYPSLSFQNNTNIFLHVIECVRKLNLNTRILSIGSSEEYGIVNNDILSETHELNPISPYAVARVSQEMLSKVYVNGFNIDIVLTRSFNHIGPGQKDIFVISSFAKQIIERKKKKTNAHITVGNIDIVRDFVDVRDVVKAYTTIVEKGVAGEVYNICSGSGISLKDILENLMIIADFQTPYIVNQDLIRPSDNPIIIGDNSKIKRELGWNPNISIEQSLKDILNYWDNNII